VFYFFSFSSCFSFSFLSLFYQQFREAGLLLRPAPAFSAATSARNCSISPVAPALP